MPIPFRKNNGAEAPEGTESFEGIHPRKIESHILYPCKSLHKMQRFPATFNQWKSSRAIIDTYCRRFYLSSGGAILYSTKPIV